MSEPAPKALVAAWRAASQRLATRRTARDFRPVARATTTSRAALAYQEEAAKWQGLIEAAAKDPALTPDQRAAAVAALRYRQEIAARGARRRIREDERQQEKAARREERQRSRGLRHG